MIGWGNNVKGQIGVSSITVGKNIPHPKTVPLPEELTDGKDQIVDIACGRKHTVLLTQAGRFWATGNLKEEKTTRLKKIKEGLAAEDDLYSRDCLWT